MAMELKRQFFLLFIPVFLYKWAPNFYPDFFHKYYISSDSDATQNLFHLHDSPTST